MFQRCDWVSNTPASARPSTIPQSLSRCQKFKHSKPHFHSPAAPALNGQADSKAAEASVRQLIANGKSKVALDGAKGIHKAQGTAASEALLVDAYAARIRSLLGQGLAVEAKALIDLVRDAF